MKERASERAILKVVHPVEWPDNIRRTPPHKRNHASQPALEQVVNTLSDLLDRLSVGYAELSLGTGGDPGAALRFVWASKPLVIAIDAHDKVFANGYAIRAYLEMLRGMQIHRQTAFLDLILRRLADRRQQMPTALDLSPEDVVGNADDVLDQLGDALSEAAVCISRGERSGAECPGYGDPSIYWSVRQGAIRIQIDAQPETPQVISVAKAALELEPWLSEVKVHLRVEGARWILRSDMRRLMSAEARRWLRNHTCLRERRPAVKMWLEELL